MRNYSGYFKTQNMWASEVFSFPFLISMFSFLGITEWEVIISSFDLSRDGPVCCINADRLEPLSLPHLSLQDLFCPKPSLPLLPVNMHRKNTGFVLTAAVCADIYISFHAALECTFRFSG